MLGGPGRLASKGKLMTKRGDGSLKKGFRFHVSHLVQRSNVKGFKARFISSIGLIGLICSIGWRLVELFNKLNKFNELNQ